MKLTINVTELVVTVHVRSGFVSKTIGQRLQMSADT